MISKQISRCVVIASLLGANVALTQPAMADTLVQVVVDHSGVLHDEQDPQGKSSFNAFVGDFLTQLARHYRRDRDGTQIKIISAVEPPHVIWSGTAADFYRNGLQNTAVQTVITGAPNGCNNLIDALEEVSVNSKIASQGSETSDVIHVITSGVHSGPDCQSLTQPDYVELVANADASVVDAFKAKSNDFEDISVHFLTATQRRAFFSGLKGAGAVKLFTQGDQPPF